MPGSYTTLDVSRSDAGITTVKLTRPDVRNAFNADDALRTCSGCGAVHPVIDLAPYGWEQVAAEVRADMEKTG